MKIILKYGIGSPGVTLLLGEPAFDYTNNILYIGKGENVVPVALKFDSSLYNYIKDTSIGYGLAWDRGILDVSLNIISGGYY